MNKPILLIYKGLPGSGKSTKAKSLFPEYVDVNRDGIRLDLFGREGMYCGDEEYVSTVQKEIIRNSLLAGHSVVVSDTNLNILTVDKLVSTGNECGAEVQFDDSFLPDFGKRMLPL